MNNIAPPKMTRAQAKLFWKSLTPQQRADFNKMLAKLNNKELQLSYVGVDDEEKIQRIVLDEKKSKPAEPFMKHFHLGKDD